MTKTFFVTAFLITTLIPVTGYPASFDCKKAKMRVERFICEEEELSKLDEDMGRAYANARRETQDRKGLALAQQKWLVERNACGTGDRCLREMYEMRITNLLAGRGTEPASKESKGEFILTRNYNPVCVAFRSNLNEFRKIDFDECHPRLSDKFPQFSRPDWKEVPLDLTVAEAKIKNVYLSGGSPEALAQAEQRWQKWLKTTESLRERGEVQMWTTEVDADNDGVIDLVAKLQYANPDGALSNLTKGCDYSHNALWLVRAADEEKRKLFNRSLGYSSDILLHKESATTYILVWSQRNVGPEYMGYNIGATRGVLVSRARNWGPVPMCHINWVPEGRFRFPGDYEPLKP